MTLLSLWRPTLQVGKQLLIKVAGLRSHLQGPAEGQEQAQQMERWRDAGSAGVLSPPAPAPAGVMPNKSRASPRNSKLLA